MNTLTEATPDLGRRREFVALAAVCALALALRLVGVHYALPHQPDPDEAHLIDQALRFGTGDLNPHYFLNPPFHAYIVFVVLGLCAGVMMGAGAVGSAWEFAERYFVDPTVVVLASRATTAVIGAASVWMTYALAGRLFGRRAALCAALFLAVAPHHVLESHWAKMDVPMVFLVLCALWVATYSAQSKWLELASAVLAGLAVATKYTAAPVVIALFVPRFGVRRSLTLGLVAIATFFAVNPFALIDYPQFIADLRLQWVASRLSFHSLYYGSQRPGIAVGYYLGQVFSPWLALVTVSALLAVPFLGGRMTSERWMAVTYLGLVAAMTFTSRLTGYRFLVPLLPFLCIFSGVTFDGLLSAAGRLRWAVWAGMAAAALTALAASAAASLTLCWPSAYTTARQWIHAHVPADSRVMMEAYTPHLIGTRDQLRQELEEIRKASPQRGRRAEFELRHEFPIRYTRFRLDVMAMESYELENVLAFRPEYVVTSTGASKRFMDMPPHSPPRVFYRWLGERGQKVFEVTSPDPFIGPLTIQVWKIIWDDSVAAGPVGDG